MLGKFYKGEPLLSNYVYITGLLDKLYFCTPLANLEMSQTVLPHWNYAILIEGKKQ